VRDNPVRDHDPGEAGRNGRSGSLAVRPRPEREGAGRASRSGGERAPCPLRGLGPGASPERPTRLTPRPTSAISPPGTTTLVSWPSTGARPRSAERSPVSSRAPSNTDGSLRGVRGHRRQPRRPGTGRNAPLPQRLPAARSAASCPFAAADRDPARAGRLRVARPPGRDARRRRVISAGEHDQHAVPDRTEADRPFPAARRRRRQTRPGRRFRYNAVSVGRDAAGSRSTCVRPGKRSGREVRAPDGEACARAEVVPRGSSKRVTPSAEGPGKGQGARRAVSPGPLGQGKGATSSCPGPTRRLLVANGTRSGPPGPRAADPPVHGGPMKGRGRPGQTLVALIAVVRRRAAAAGASRPPYPALGLSRARRAAALPDHDPRSNAAPASFRGPSSRRGPTTSPRTPLSEPERDHRSHGPGRRQHARSSRGAALRPAAAPARGRPTGFDGPRRLRSRRSGSRPRARTRPGARGRPSTVDHVRAVTKRVDGPTGGIGPSSSPRGR